MLKLEIVQKANKSGITYPEFIDIPDKHRIHEFTPIGTKVWAARFPKSYKMSLKKYHHVGQDKHPLGGYTLLDEEENRTYCCYYDGAIIHPDNFKVKRIPKTKKVKNISKIEIDFFE